MFTRTRTSHASACCGAVERFGLDGIALGRHVAVLAVDPASKRGGGAILGDKTRMAELAKMSEAFIRPSSAGDKAGGVC